MMKEWDGISGYKYADCPEHRSFVGPLPYAVVRGAGWLFKKKTKLQIQI